MSNAVDILICDGVLAGKVWCQQRPVPPTAELHAPDGTLHDYNFVVYDERYWVGVVDAEDLSAVADAISEAYFAPSWDLLRALGEHP